jgi:hypothetical protein
MIIDFHSHVGDFRYSLKSSSYPPLPWKELIARLDDEGIDKAAVLPVYNASPEFAPIGITCSKGMSVAAQVLEAKKYSDRVIMFGNLDPREGKDFSEKLEWFKENNCVGIGEIMSKMPYDDPRVVSMFKQIGKYGMIITIESDPGKPYSTGYGAGFEDDPGMPRLGNLLQEVPETIIIGHGAGFWAGIAPVTTYDEKCSYPFAPIKSNGALACLFRKYPNLYADISARSGFGALARDPRYAEQFLEEFQDRLLFGTDIISRGRQADRKRQKRLIESLIESMISYNTNPEVYNSMIWGHAYMPQLDYLKALLNEKRISKSAYNKITGGNARKLINMV